MKTLAELLVALGGPIARKVLISLGIGFITFQGVDTAVNTALSAARNNFAGVTGDVAQLIALSGINWAMGTIAGGITAGVTMMILSKMAKIA
jgi:hypothetical protein